MAYSDPRKITFVGDYLPRKFGIATLLVPVTGSDVEDQCHEAAFGVLETDVRKSIGRK